MFPGNPEIFRVLAFIALKRGEKSHKKASKVVSFVDTAKNMIFWDFHVVKALNEADTKNYSPYSF